MDDAASILGGFNLLPQPRQNVLEASPEDADPLREGLDCLPDRSARGKRRKGLLPEGVLHRSPGHADLLRKGLELAKERKDNADSKVGAQALAGAWNRSSGLREGDNVDFTVAETSKCPNAWTHHGLMQVGWAEVGKHASHKSGQCGVGETRRPLDGLLPLAGVLQRATLQQFHTWLKDLPGLALHINRHHDPTQLRLQFGSLQEKLSPLARYVVPDLKNPGRYTTVKWG